LANVMVVDDSLFIRIILSDLITKGGHTVVGTASDGAEAVEQYEKLKPEIVFMDITMPNVNGIDGVKRIKAIDEKAKIIMCSAMGQTPIVVEAIQAGAIDFVVKPFTPEKIMGSIRKAEKNNRFHVSKTNIN